MFEIYFTSNGYSYCEIVKAVSPAEAIIILTTKYGQVQVSRTREL